MSAPSTTARQAETAGAADRRTLRIGEVAELTGTTPRTIRYYEEIGLLEPAADRAQGRHRCYTQAELDRVREIVRLRDLLGLSLEQLKQLLAAESARAHLREELRQTEAPAQRRRILVELGEHIASQLELVRGRLRELGDLATELADKQALVARKIAEIDRS
ncbi:MAG: MerR family transcriptional regulator [Solirubrobacteraceae bacterium]